MKTRLQNIKFPQTISELVSIDTEKLPISQWTGAVNFLFVREQLFLIKRSETMNSHKGQLAFVGGHKQKNENDPIETAKREFEEETSMDSSKLKILGLSQPVLTTSKNIIIPVVSYLDMDGIEFLENIESNGEWTDGILVSWEKLTSWDYWVKGDAIKVNGLRHSILFFPVSAVNHHTKSKESKNKFLLWGATARMIWKFFKNYS